MEPYFRSNAIPSISTIHSGFANDFTIRSVLAGGCFIPHCVKTRPLSCEKGFHWL